MRYTVLFCSKTGAKRVNPGQARSGSHARRPTPRRLSVFCSTTLDIRLSNAHAEPVFAKNGHSANSPRQAGEVQCLGEMPWASRATALRPDPHQVRKTRSGSIALRDGLAEGPPRPENMICWRGERRCRTSTKILNIGLGSRPNGWHGRVPQIMMHFGRTEVRCLHSSGKALAMLSMWDVARGESRAF